jgi:hypothetical protein
MERRRQRKCGHCEQLYQPDLRNRWHQQYCSQAVCQSASKAASQRHWVRSALGRRYFKRPKHAQRVKLWREAHPGYWKRKRQAPVALQDVLIPQTLVAQVDKPKLIGTPLTISTTLPGDLSSAALNLDALKAVALQDVLFTQSPAWFGLIAQLTGVALPDDIAAFTRQAILLGREILGQIVTPRRPSGANGEASHLPSAVAQNSRTVQLDRPSPCSG